MRKWHFYDLQTGLFTGRVLLSEQGLPEPERVVNLPGGGQTTIPARPGITVPDGCAAVEWPGGAALKTRARRVNLKTGEVEPYQPDPPADDELRTWAWDKAAEKWNPEPTETATKLQRVVELQAAIVAREAAQARPLREMLVALSDGKAVPPESASKLVAIEADVAALRAEIASAKPTTP